MGLFSCIQTWKEAAGIIKEELNSLPRGLHSLVEIKPKFSDYEWLENWALNLSAQEATSNINIANSEFALVWLLAVTEHWRRIKDGKGTYVKVFPRLFTNSSNIFVSQQGIFDRRFINLLHQTCRQYGLYNAFDEGGRNHYNDRTFRYQFGVNIYKIEQALKGVMGESWSDYLRRHGGNDDGGIISDFMGKNHAFYSFVRRCHHAQKGYVDGLYDYFRKTEWIPDDPAKNAQYWTNLFIEQEQSAENNNNIGDHPRLRYNSDTESVEIVYPKRLGTPELIDTNRILVQLYNNDEEFISNEPYYLKNGFFEIAKRLRKNIKTGQSPIIKLKVPRGDMLNYRIENWPDTTWPILVFDREGGDVASSICPEKEYYIYKTANWRENLQIHFCLDSNDRQIVEGSCCTVPRGTKSLLVTCGDEEVQSVQSSDRPFEIHYKFDTTQKVLADYIPGKRHFTGWPILYCDNEFVNYEENVIILLTHNGNELYRAIERTIPKSIDLTERLRGLNNFNRPSGVVELIISNNNNQTLQKIKFNLLPYDFRTNISEPIPFGRGAEIYFSSDFLNQERIVHIDANDMTIETDLNFNDFSAHVSSKLSRDGVYIESNGEVFFAGNNNPIFYDEIKTDGIVNICRPTEPDTPIKLIIHWLIPAEGSILLEDYVFLNYGGKCAFRLTSLQDLHPKEMDKITRLEIRHQNGLLQEFSFISTAYIPPRCETPHLEVDNLSEFAYNMYIRHPFSNRNFNDNTEDRHPWIMAVPVDKQGTDRPLMILPEGRKNNRPLQEEYPDAEIYPEYIQHGMHENGTDYDIYVPKWWKRDNEFWSNYGDRGFIIFFVGGNAKVPVRLSAGRYIPPTKPEDIEDKWTNAFVNIIDKAEECEKLVITCSDRARKLVSGVIKLAEILRANNYFAVIYLSGHTSGFGFRAMSFWMPVFLNCFYPQWQTDGHGRNVKLFADVLEKHWDWELIGYKEFTSGVVTHLGIDFLEKFKFAIEKEKNAFIPDDIRPSWHDLLCARLSGRRDKVLTSTELRLTDFLAGRAIPPEIEALSQEIHNWKLNPNIESAQKLRNSLIALKSEEPQNYNRLLVPRLTQLGLGSDDNNFREQFPLAAN